MNLEEAIFYVYPTLTPNVDFVIAKDEFDQDYILEWNVVDIPKPTMEELEESYFIAKRDEKLIILKQESTLEIYSGFTSATTGHSYSFSEYDQNNFTQQMVLLLADPTITEISWKTIDSDVVVHTKEQFLGVISDANIHKRDILSRLWTLESQVNNATTVDEINNIIW